MWLPTPDILETLAQFAAPDPKPGPEGWVSGRAPRSPHILGSPCEWPMDNLFPSGSRPSLLEDQVHSSLLPSRLAQEALEHKAPPPPLHAVWTLKGMTLSQLEGPPPLVGPLRPCVPLSGSLTSQSTAVPSYLGGYELGSDETVCMKCSQMGGQVARQ